MQWTGQKIMFDLRRDIFRHMQRMHVGFFDTHAVGRLVTRLTSDVDAVNDMFTDGILAIVNDFFTLTHHGRGDAGHQLVAGAAGFRGAAHHPGCHAHISQSACARATAACARPSPASTALLRNMSAA